MTFPERYNQATTWHEKAMIMEIFHLAMLSHRRDWTINGTAGYFNCSIGLVSENLRLARALHTNINLLKCESRQDALKKLNGRMVSDGIE